MPPANSRRTSYSTSPEPSAQRPHTPPSYLSALREIESPPLGGLNLASTLLTAVDDEEAEAANEANVSFLRTPIDPQDEWRAQNAAAAAGEPLGETVDVRQRMQDTLTDVRTEDRARRERLQRVLQRLNRMHDPAYGDRLPGQNTLYDWSPGNLNQGGLDLDGEDDEDQLQEILHDLRHQQPNTHPEILRVLGRSQLDAEREARTRSHSSRFLSTQPSQSESSLRSAAILQSVRRHPRFSARSRDYMQRYIMDRERVGHDGEDRDRFHPSRILGAAGSGSESSRYEYARSAWQAQQQLSDHESALRADVRARVESYRRGYLPSPSGGPPRPSTWLQESIRYLGRIRYCSPSNGDSISHAVDAGFGIKEFFGDNQEDFILDTNVLPRPAETSWLASGAVFSGSQHATTGASTLAPATMSGSTTTRYLFRNNDTMTSTTFDARPAPFDPARPWLSRTYAPPAYRESENTSVSSQHQDRWPVKVTIHAVDYDNMNLSATMEAYNVPSHSPASIISSANSSLTSATNPTAARTSSITTYLEGEILDFTRHTFLTESFKSTLETDATYWSKLEPFARFTDDELLRKLVSRSFMEELSRNYILMRWKERCFVRSSRTRPQDSRIGWRRGDDEEVAEDGCGLTISGFYYVCLRRRDGAVEGLYCDPQSSPYQHLKLNPVGGGAFPAWKFR